MAIMAAPHRQQSQSAPAASGELVKAHLSIKSWIENRAAMPAFIGLLAAMILRGAQVWSFGTFSVSALPPLVRVTFDDVTGLAIAASLELLMSAAGAQWWRLRRESLAIAFDLSKPKREREKLAKLAESDAKLYAVFAALGGACSMGGNVFFAITSTHNSSLGAMAVDILIAAVVTCGIFFFAVIYEPSRPDTSQLYQSAVEDRLHTQSLLVASNIASGSATPEQIAFLKGRVSPQMARSLDQLIPRESGMEYWDAPRIVRWLGLEGETAGRDVRRKLQRASTDPRLGLRKKSKGQGWEAPQSAVLSIFLEDIQARMASTSGPLLNGGSVALNTEQTPTGAAAAGQPADATRRTAGPHWLEVIRAATAEPESGVPSEEVRTS